MSTVTNSAPPADVGQFNYKIVSPLSPLSVVLGALSLFGFLTVLVIPLALVGLVLGISALGKIKKFNTEYGGKLLTAFGVSLCAVGLFGGTSWQIYSYTTEVPDGFTRISFVSDISRKGFIEEEGTKSFHPDIAQLDNGKLFFKGYMYPDGRVEDIDSFILCKDSGDCCFGGNPKLTDMIRVVMNKETGMAKFYPNLVSVAGEFSLKDIRRAGELMPVYELDATHFRVSKNLY